MEILPEYREDIVSVGMNESQNITVGNAVHLISLLSTTLYSNPDYAACREILTNAWDAHIASGITDTCLEITTTENTITISDSGSGISRDRFMELYGVVGGSDKQTNNSLTGGMGIGKMAPLAAMSHFSVRSHHSGIATLYHIESASESSGGFPTITEVTQTTTDRTGLDVIFPECTPTLISNIKEVVRLGAIKAKFNGDELDTIPDKPEVLVHSNAFQSNSIPRHTSIAIRYGNITYPYKFCDSHNTQWLTRANCFLVIKVPGGSINISPNRESIVYTDATKNLLEELVTDSLERVNRSIVHNMHKFAETDSDGYVRTKSETNQKIFSLEDLITEPLPVTFYMSYYNSNKDSLAVYQKAMRKSVPSYFSGIFQTEKQIKYVNWLTRAMHRAGVEGSRCLGRVYNKLGTLENIHRFQDYSYSPFHYLLQSIIVIHFGRNYPINLMQDNHTYIRLLRKSDAALLGKMLESKGFKVIIQSPPAPKKRSSGPRMQHRVKHFCASVLLDHPPYREYVTESYLYEVAQPDIIDVSYYVDGITEGRYVKAFIPFFKILGVEGIKKNQIALVTNRQRSNLERRVNPAQSVEVLVKKHITEWSKLPRIQRLLKTVDKCGLKTVSNMQKERGFFEGIYGKKFRLTERDYLFLEVIAEHYDYWINILIDDVEVDKEANTRFQAYKTLWESIRFIGLKDYPEFTKQLHQLIKRTVK